jgi:cell division septal protein FtsQ
LRSLPTVLQAEVTPLLPDTVSVHIVERQPAAYWVSGEQTYLVDSEGIILETVDGAAGGLPTIAQPEGPPLSPGDQVDASALATSARLAGLLPRAGIQPLAFEWSPDGGVEVPTQEGWRARFDGQRGDVERQVDALKNIRALLQKTKASAAVIDVRYGDRPYYR